MADSPKIGEIIFEDGAPSYVLISNEQRRLLDAIEANGIGDFTPVLNYQPPRDWVID
jgi:hypothetical protein